MEREQLLQLPAFFFCFGGVLKVRARSEEEAAGLVDAWANVEPPEGMTFHLETQGPYESIDTTTTAAPGS